MVVREAWPLRVFRSARPLMIARLPDPKTRRQTMMPPA